MKHYFLLSIVIISLIFISCSNDDDAEAISETNSDFNTLVVYIEGEGSSGIDVQWGSETFCYDDGSCSTSDGVSFASTNGDSRIDLSFSNTSKTAVGVRIPSIQVNSGSGTVQVVKSSYTMVDGFEEFEDGETVFTSEILSSGDTFTLEYGTLE